MQLDHVVLKVDDLAIATRDFTSLGFTVTPGGDHPGRGTRNALVPFADGTYLELISFPPPPPKKSKAAAAAEEVSFLDRWERWKSSPEGLVDFALLVKKVEEDTRAEGKRILGFQGPYPGSRKRPDGEVVSWNLGLPNGFDLPFLCADVTRRSSRVPEGPAREHKNGAQGILALSIGVEDLEGAIERYRILLGTPPNLERLEFALEGAKLRLERIRGREGPVWMRIAVPRGAPAGPLHPRKTHGARLELVPVA